MWRLIAGSARGVASLVTEGRQVHADLYYRLEVMNCAHTRLCQERPGIGSDVSPLMSIRRPNAIASSHPSDTGR